MKFSTLCEVIAAMHLTSFVTSPIENRGGLMLVAPPGHLKTTAAEILQEFANNVVISNLDGHSLNSMREDFISGNIRTMVFSDLAQLYRRHGSVSANLEGSIMSLAGEGFRKPSHSDQRVQAMPARCTMIGCMTIKFMEENEARWLDNGFYRRFLWCRYRMDHPEDLEDALWQWRKADIDGNFSARIPTSRNINYTLQSDEVDAIRKTLTRSRIIDKKMPAVISQRIMCVLKWKFSKHEPKKPMDLWKDFSESLGSDGCLLKVREEK